MNKEVTTEKGVGIHIPEIEDIIEQYSVLVHLSPVPKKTPCFKHGGYDGEISIILTEKKNIFNMLGSLPFNTVVECANDNGFETTSGIKLTDKECSAIDDKAWDILIKKYGIAPTELTL